MTSQYHKALLYLILGSQIDIR